MPTADVSSRAEDVPEKATTRTRAPYSLVSGLTVQRTNGGGLVIEAPPETASTLAALFSGLAQLIQAAIPPMRDAATAQDHNWPEERRLSGSQR